MRSLLGTKTAKGFIPHLQMVTAAGVTFDAPVKVTTRAGSSHGVQFVPQMAGDLLIFALPGGGEILDAMLPPNKKGAQL